MVRPPRRERLALLSLLPNMVTILGLCAGLTAIRFVLAGRFDLAAALIVFAAVIDGLDGLLARKLNAASEIGGELDSLSDFVNFGVAPGIIVFQFALRQDFATGWVFVLIYSACTCLRLARFNVTKDDPPPAGRPHFIGVPAPGGAMLALFPLFLHLEGLVDARALPEFYGLYLAGVGVLMVSRVPTLSSKAVRVRREWAVGVLIGGVVVAGLVVTRPWMMLVILTAAYWAATVWALLRYVQRRAS
ncbi:MAG: CDP-diacylglycerol--serine O-phosphatidyltransferase [Gemmobacter sp.]